MPKLHSIELLPDDEGAAAVTERWQALRDAGLPSQLDHQGDTNTPHVTLLEGRPVTDAHAEAAIDLLGPLLPVVAAVSGLLVLGDGQRVTLAWALDVPDAVTAAVLRLRERTDPPRHRGWLAHVSLARRLPRESLARALELAAPGGAELRLTGMRRWDPDAGERGETTDLEIASRHPPRQP